MDCERTTTINERKQIIDKSHKEWEAARTWSKLLHLNRRWLSDSKEGVFAVSIHHLGPWGCDATIISSMLELHKYGLMTVGGDGCRCGAVAGYYYRQVPYLDFILRDEGSLTDAFIRSIHQDPNLVVYVTNGGGGVVASGSTPKIVRSLTRSSPTSGWKIEETAGRPVSLMDFSLDNHPVTSRQAFLLCQVSPKLDDGILYTASDKDFMRKTQKIDIFKKIRDAAKKSEVPQYF